MSCNNQKVHLFTSESVTKGHPDKVADQISDAILDSLLRHDRHARVACETLVTTGLVVLAGEVTVHNPAAERALLKAEDTTREVISSIGYNEAAGGFDFRSCSVLKTLHGQSENIARGVNEGKQEQGAGDQGLMFGFACDETCEFMPMPIQLAHRLTARLSEARENGDIRWLRPDGKSQVTVRYVDGMPERVETIVLSTQHSEEAVDPKTDEMSAKAKEEIIRKIIKPVIMIDAPHMWHNGIVFHINPTGKFVIGGPHGDAGLTGRKIIVDTYGGRGRHGGGAFSGKDPSKVDRSATYMARYVAKNIVAAGLAKEAEVQLSYAIGVAEPVSVLVDCSGTAKVKEEKIAKAVRDIFPLKPREIIQHLNLLRPIYRDTAHDGHFGRVGPNFTWERLNMVKALKKACKV